MTKSPIDVFSAGSEPTPVESGFFAKPIRAARNRSRSPTVEPIIPTVGFSTGSGSLTHHDTAIPSIEVESVASPTESSSQAETAGFRTPSVTASPPPASSTSQQGQIASQEGASTPSEDRSGSIASRVGNMNLSTPRSSLGMSDVVAAIKDVENGTDERIRLPEPETLDLHGISPRLRSRQKTRSRSNSLMPQPPYDGEDEELPPHRLHEPATQQGFEDAKALMSSLVRVLGSDDLHRDPDSTIHRLYKQAKALADFHCPATRTVGFVGESGVGKSSLLNALLDHRDLARMSGSGAACTCVVTEYHYQDRDGFAIDVEIFTMDELKEQVTDLLKTYRHYHLHVEDMETDAEIDHAKRGADTALDTFQAMFRSRLPDKQFLLSEPESHVRSTLHTFIEDIKPPQPAQPEIITDLNQCSSRLAELTSELPSATETSAVWPYIQKIKVFLKARILGKGLVLVDLPGLGDLNSARQEITMRYLLACDEIFAVCDIIRATTDARVAHVFELARQAKLSNVGIICSRSDVIVPEEAKKDLHEPQAARVQRLMDAVTANTRKRHRIKGSRDEYLEWPYDELDEEEKQLSNDLTRALEAVERTLERDKLELHTILVQDRNTKVLRELRDSYRNKFPGIRSTPFCVSSKDYWDYREQPKDKALPVLHLSGILAVRKHCLSMVADNQLRLITKYIRDDIPALLGDVTLWVESGAGSLDLEEKRAFRQVLDNVERSLRTAIQGHDSLIVKAPEHMKTHFDVFVYDDSFRRHHEWAAHAREAGRRWASWHHATYSAFCRQHGDYCTPTVGKHNWNEEAIEEMVTVLHAKWESLLSLLSNQHDSIAALIRNVLKDAIKDIESHGLPESTATLSWTLASRKNVFASEIRQLREKFDTDISIVGVCALSGLRISLIGKAMEGAYKSANRESGRGSDARRKAVINNTLQRPDLIKKLLKDFRTQFGDVADGFYEKISVTAQTHLRDIQLTFDTVRSETVALESEQNSEFRDRVNAAMDVIKAKVQQIQGDFDLQRS